jgi:hypothetical protein
MSTQNMKSKPLSNITPGEILDDEFHMDSLLRQ